ncbi:MAG: S16 family serine protease [Nanoarchaeota archaeon]
MGKIASADLERRIRDQDKEFSRFERRKPPEGLAQLKGQETALESILRYMAINSANFNIMCVGPPGTGKSFMMRCIMDEMNFYLTNGKDREKIRHHNPIIRQMVAEAAESLSQRIIPETVAMYNFFTPAEYHPQHGDPLIFLERRGAARELKRDMESFVETLLTRMQEREAPRYEAYDTYIEACKTKLRRTVEKPWTAEEHRLRFKLDSIDDTTFDFADHNDHNKSLREQDPEAYARLSAKFRVDVYEPALAAYHENITRKAFAKERPGLWKRMLATLQLEENALRRTLKLKPLSLADYVERARETEYYPDTSENIVRLYVSNLREKYAWHPALTKWIDSLEEYLRKPSTISTLETFAEQRHHEAEIIKSKLIPHILVDLAEEKRPIIYDMIGAATWQNMLGEAAHSAYNDTPEHLRLFAGALTRNHVLFIDEPIKMLTDEKLHSQLLTMFQTGWYDISGAETSDSAHIRASLPCHAKVAMDTNTNFLEGHDAMAQRFQMAPFEEYLNVSDTPQMITDLVRSEIQRHNRKTNGTLRTPNKEGMTALVRLMAARTGRTGLYDASLRPLINLVIEMMQGAQAYGKLGGDEIILDDQYIISQLDHRRQGADSGHDRFHSFSQLHMTMPPATAIGRVYGLEVSGLKTPIWPWSEVGNPTLIEASTAPRSEMRERVHLATRNTKLIGDDAVKGSNLSGDYIRSRVAKLDVDIRVNYLGTYSETSGPSASAAETYTIISALTGIPLSQRIGVTGTILDYKGRVGPIGAVATKTFSFYDFFSRLCEVRGAPFEGYGMMVPDSNLEELTLDIPKYPSLHAAIKEGQFTIYTHSTIDEGASTLMGLPAEGIMETLAKVGNSNI